MKFQFKIQAFQTEAAESVVRVFAGQRHMSAYPNTAAISAARKS
jgi:hypothetical protein